MADALLLGTLRRWGRVALLVAGFGLAHASAQTRQSEADLQAIARAWLGQAVVAVRNAEPKPTRVVVEVGALDARLQLQACAQVEPYMPTGQRLWGHTRLGLRCLSGPVRWNVFLPVAVKVYGPAWVLRRDVMSGVALGEGDVMAAEVEWSQEASPVLAQVQPWLGMLTTRPLATGQALRQNLVRAAQVFQAGAQVRVRAQGPGFQITSDGQALTPGVVGELSKVRMDSGRIMSGVVVDAHTVRIEL